LLAGPAHHKNQTANALIAHQHVRPTAEDRNRLIVLRCPGEGKADLIQRADPHQIVSRATDPKGAVEVAACLRLNLDLRPVAFDQDRLRAALAGSGAHQEVLLSASSLEVW